MRIARVAVVLAFIAVSSVGVQAATKRALLIGINHYSPTTAEAAALKKISAEPHKADSRFAPGYEWPDLNGPLNDVESMHLLLRDTYGFPDANITILKDRDATREAILKAINNLIAATQPGDQVVFFFAGHGSQRLNSTTGVNTAAAGKEEGRDQTIVPADAYKGTYDIRDKELAQLFNKILDDKKARLVAIFDSCHSGTMARGIPAPKVKARLLDYDDRDVAKDPTAYKGDDLKHVPKDGNAIILSASLPSQSAQEEEYPDDNLVHGVFTRALVSVLKNANASWSAVDVINSVQYVMKADNDIPQQPVVEGRVNESLFGGHGPTSLHASVVDAKNGVVHLNLGSVAGFDVGTKFTSANGAAKTTVLEVTKVDEPNQCTAKTVSGTDPAPGALFTLTEMHPREAAKLRIYVPSTDWNPAAAPAQQAKTKFPGFTWVADPALEQVQYYVTFAHGDWHAYDIGGTEISAAAVKALASQGKPHAAFVALPATAKIAAALQALAGFKNKVFEILPAISGTDYMLVGRDGANGKEYALLRSDFMGPRPAGGYIESLVSKDSKDKVVCGQDRSLPVRTEWVAFGPDTATSYEDPAVQLEKVAGRIAKLRGWMGLQTENVPSNFWPYHLTVEAKTGAAAQVVTPTSVLAAQTPYDFTLETTQNELSGHAVQSLYAYVIGFDCSAHSYLMYPGISSNGGSPQPAPKGDGSFPTKVVLGSERVGAPYGADSLFLLVTPDKITDLTVFDFDGVVSAGARGIGSKLGNMVQGLGNYGSRGIDSSSDKWTMQSVLIPSKAPGN